MSVTIGTINIDFTVIPDDDSTLIIVGDKSTWLGAENLPATISLTPPGSIKPITETFQKHKLNLFNSVNLGLSCLSECTPQEYTELPDGIWKIEVRSGYSGFEKTRYHLKTDQFQLKLDEIYTKMGLEYDINNKQLRKDLSDIDFLKTMASAYCRRGDFIKASRNFTEAEKLLNNWK